MRGLRVIDPIPLKLLYHNGEYAWVKEATVTEHLTRSGAISIGYWIYKIKISEIDTALNLMSARHHTTALFNDRKYLYTY